MNEKIRAAYGVWRAAAESLADVKWRQGRSNPCNIYAITDDEDWKKHIPIGSFITPELAFESVYRHNSQAHFQ